jgi:hypothetical protein
MIGQVCNACISLQIVEKVSQRSSSHRSDNSGREVHQRHTDEMCDVPSQLVLDRMQISVRQRYGIPLHMVANINSISGLEGAGGLTVFVSDK